VPPDVPLPMEPPEAPWIWRFVEDIRLVELTEAPLCDPPTDGDDIELPLLDPAPAPEDAPEPLAPDPEVPPACASWMFMAPAARARQPHAAAAARKVFMLFMEWSPSGMNVAPDSAQVHGAA
jgi:hypothetical protein